MIASGGYRPRSGLDFQPLKFGPNGNFQRLKVAARNVLPFPVDSGGCLDHDGRMDTTQTGPFSSTFGPLDGVAPSDVNLPRVTIEPGPDSPGGIARPAHPICDPAGGHQATTIFRWIYIASQKLDNDNS